MAVTADHRAETGRSRIEVELIRVVEDVENRTFDFDDLSFRQAAGPGAFVDVAANGCDRSERSQSIENIR